MHNWDKVRQDNKFKQKLHNIKSSLPKISFNVNKQQNNKRKLYTTNPASVPQSNYTEQNYVKQLLREFGLGQYLRKMFELGYDDNNINKLGELNQKEFEQLILSLRIFPGHHIKMANFYEYLRQVHIYKNAKKQNISNGIYNKPKSSLMTHSNQRKIQSSRINQKSATTKHFYVVSNSNTGHSNLNSFLGGTLGYNYNINNNKQNTQKIQTQKNYNKIEEELFKDETSKNYIVDNNKYMNDNDTDNDIDRMLKYYMKELNEKLDESYESIEDSSLSYVNITNRTIHENREFEEISRIKEGNNILDIKKTSNVSKEDVVLPKANKLNTNITTNNSKQVNPPISNKNIPIKLPSIQKNKTNASETKNTVSNKESLNNSKTQRKGEIEVKEEKKENKESKEVKEEKMEKEENKNENDNDIEDYDFDKDDNIDEDIIPKKENSPKNEKNKESVILTEKNKEENHKTTEEFGHQTSLIQNENNKNDAIINIKPQDDEEEEKEQEYIENLRLTKSSEGDYLRQTADDFNIDYICRCLALAIIKHIESGKDNQHITDLIDAKGKFTFFYSLYNNKIEYLLNFFNKNAKTPELSNLDRLEQEEENIKKKRENISFVSHFKQKKDETLIKETEAKDKLNKIHTNFTDIEKDIKFIDEFFIVNNKRAKNYQGLSEKTKNILNKDLSYINEVDNELTISKMSDKSKNNEKRSMKKIKDKEEERKLKEKEEEEEEKEENEEEEEEHKEDFKDKKENSEEKKIEQKEKEDDKKEEASINNRFTSLNNDNNTTNNNNNQSNIDENKQISLNKISEELPPENQELKETFESGEMESNYLIDVSTFDKLKSYLIKQIEIFDDDYNYTTNRIQTKKYISPPVPQLIFEFCANIIFLTKMEKEVLIITLIYLERLIFNTGLLITSRNWKRLIFTVMMIASEMWDDDSFENNHFSQVFTHLKLGEINSMERTFLELINYKLHVKCSEYFKYFFIIKSISLIYNFNGNNLVPISVEKMMKIQEYAYQMQKKMRRRFSLNNSAEF